MSYPPFVTDSSDFSLLAKEQGFALKAIRQESTDAYNRLHSIAEDGTFISRVTQAYPTFRVYPNLRCGAWYVDPEIARGEPAYFKSTDGHFGQWRFNLRRSNLHLLGSVSESDGIVLVDSTRRGKRLPDALAKTVPIWCAVINLAVAKASNIQDASPQNANSMLYTPPGTVSRSEHSQIELCLETWATDLLSSEYSIPPLKKPLRPIWITPSTLKLPQLDAVDFFPVVCVSASKLVTDGIERRSAGFVYVQGSGDDHESWSQGLTPQLYWQNKAQLLSCTRSELSDTISALVRSEGEQHINTVLPVSITRVNSRIATGRIPSAAFDRKQNKNAYVIIASRPFAHLTPPRNTLLLEFQSGKKGQHSLLVDILPRSLEFTRHHLQLGNNVVILCDDGKDVSVGVAVAALSTYFDDKGTFISETGPPRKQTKQAIHKRLQWILADNFRANPSRTTLKRVNEFLMSPPRAERFSEKLAAGQNDHGDLKDSSTPETVLYSNI